MLVEDDGLVEQPKHSQYSIPLLNIKTIDDEPLPNPSCDPEGEDLAYCIFSSTGSAKAQALMIEQGSLMKQLHDKVSDLDITSTDRVAQTAPAYFDIALWQCLAALTQGAAIVILREPTLTSSLVMAATIQQKNISVIQQSPSSLSRWVSDLEGEDPIEFPTLKYVSTVNEPLLPGLCRRWLSLYPHIPLLNHFGPTECADGVIRYINCTPPAVDVVHSSIDKPIRNLTACMAQVQSEGVAASSNDSARYGSRVDAKESKPSPKLVLAGGIDSGIDHTIEQSVTPTMHFMAEQLACDRHWNISGLWDSSASDVDVDLLAQAFDQLSCDYPHLSSRIEQHRGQLNLRISRDAICLERQMIGFFDSYEACEVAVSNTISEMQCAFVFDGQCPLTRFVWIDAEVNQQPQSWLFLMVHHYLIDSAGFCLLLNEIERYYDHKISRLACSPIYQDGSQISLWLKRAIQSIEKNIEKEILFWGSQPWPLLLGDREAKCKEAQLALSSDEKIQLGREINRCVQQRQYRSKAFIKLCEKNHELYYTLSVSKTQTILALDEKDGGFSAIDLILYALTHELGEGESYKGLYLDCYDRHREASLSDYDLSKVMGMALQLSPLPLVLNTQDDIIQQMLSVSVQRRDVPHCGVGLGIAKHCLADDCPQVIANIPCPEISINYCINPLDNRADTLLAMNESPIWVGESRRLRAQGSHRLAITIDAEAGHLRFHLRYDPDSYSSTDIRSLNQRLQLRIHHSLETIGQALDHTPQARNVEPDNSSTILVPVDEEVM